MRRWNFIWLLPVALSAIYLAGCTSLPDVGPFVESTAGVRSAVAQAGATVAEELKRMKGGEAYAEQLDEQWSTRIDALNAMVDYSESLQSIVSASRQGAQSVGALADSVTQLAGAAGIVVPASAGVGVAVDTAKTIYREIAVMRAAKSLEEALERSRRPVDDIAMKIGQDIADLKDIFQAANDSITGDLEIDHQQGIDFRSRLEKRREALYANGADGLTAAENRELTELNELIASTNDWYVPLQTNLNEARIRLAVGESLIATTSDTVRQWGLAYTNLVLAMKDRRPVNTLSLTRATIDIRDLIKRIREL
jgi:hypothetical protein